MNIAIQTKEIEMIAPPAPTAARPADRVAASPPVPDGPVPGALLPLVRLGGKLFVAQGALHFYAPSAPTRPGQASKVTES